jgi:nicotinamidase-related amidase
MDRALLLVDIQNDYFAGGENPLEGSLEASENARQAMLAFRERQMPILHVQHVSNRPGATFFLPDTDGVNIHNNVHPLPGEAKFVKHFPNSFRDTELLAHLKKKGISRLVIAGMMTHMCIDATVRAAFDHGFSCTVLEDACATRSLSFGGVDVPADQVHAAFLAALSAVYAKVVRTEDFLEGFTKLERP